VERKLSRREVEEERRQWQGRGGVLSSVGSKLPNVSRVENATGSSKLSKTCTA